MSTYTRFGSLLAKQVEAGLMPQALFTDNADMRNSLSRLADLAFGKSTMEDKQVLGSVESFSRVVNDRYVNAKYSDIFRKVAGVFGQKLSKGVEQLHQTKRLVNKMCSVMQTYVDNRYSADAVLSVLTGKDKPMKLANIAWEVFNIIDERNVRANVNLSIEKDINNPITHTYMMQAINKLPYANTYNQIPIEKIHLENGKFTKIVDVVQSRLPKIDHSHVVGIIQNILELNESNMRSMVYSATALANGRNLKDMNKYMTLACEYVQVLDALKPDVLNISNSLMEEYRKHADVFNQYAETILYIASYYRNEVWKNSVLLPGGLINTDTYQEYVSKGGSMNDIVRHRNQYYQKDPIPTKGISGEFISQSVEGIKNNLSEMMVKNADEIEKKKRTIERDSFIAVSTEYLSGNTNKLDPKFAYKNAISRYAATVFDATANLPIETRFYRMLMGSCHINDIVSNMYDRLEKAYTVSSENLGKLDMEDKLKIETAVYADMVAEYLVNSGIIVC